MESASAHTLPIGPLTEHVPIPLLPAQWMIDRHQAAGSVLDEVIAHRLGRPVGEAVGDEGKAGVLHSAAATRRPARSTQARGEYTTRNVPHVERCPFSRE